MTLKALLLTFSLILVFPAWGQFPFLNAEIATEILVENLKLSSSSEIASTSQTRIWIEGDRQYTKVELQAPEAGSFQLLISAPISQVTGLVTRQKKLPVLFLTTGYLSGMESVRLIANPGNLILVGFQYPFQKNQVEKDPSLLFKMLRIVPSQIALSLEWLSRQEPVSRSQIHVMGVSLGGLFLPVSLHLAAVKGVPVRSTIFAYTGADFKLLFQQMLGNNLPESIRESVADSLKNLFLLHDPELYLPKLKGPFLCIYATQDEIFPFESNLRQYELLQGPKDVHWLTGPHIDVDKKDMIQKTMSLVIDFLQKQSASIPQ